MSTSAEKHLGAIQGAPMQQDLLKNKSDIHLSRKLWHCFGICLMAAVYHFLGSRISWILVLSISAVIIPVDILRQRHNGLNKVALRVFGPLMRRHESQALSGMTYLFLGCMFLLVLNQKHLVTLTLLFLAFGDPIASFFGIRFGKDKILANKTLQGTVAAFVTCTVLSAIYYYFNNLMTERLLIVAPISGLIGALAELIPIGKLDDNFTFPVVSSLLLWVLFKVYGGFGI
jgi:dolichol kinase